MARPLADAPSYRAEPDEKDSTGAPRQSVPLQVQLMIEVALLMGIGLVMIYSASSVIQFKHFSDKIPNAGSTAHHLTRHLISIAVGVGAIAFVSQIPYRWYRDHVRWMLLLTLATLAIVLIPGIGAEINGARRWIQFRGIQFQPAEFAKVVWVLFLAVSLTRKQDKIKKFATGFLPHIIICGIFAGLLLKEPDFGTTFMIGVLTVTMLVLAGVPFWQILLLAPVAAGGFYKAVYKVPYRWDRISAFMNPWTDPLDSGYQLIQAWIAVGSGGLFGKGLGAGQQKLFYLPEPYTDFILAVIGEELGFVGIVCICLIFFFLFRTGLEIARRAPDLLGTLMAAGLTMLLSLQALLNMCVVLGLVPTKGLPLPFISYGGSAFTANCLAIGVLVSIARSGERQMRQNV